MYIRKCVRPQWRSGRRTWRWRGGGAREEREHAGIDDVPDAGRDRATADATSTQRRGGLAGTAAPQRQTTAQTTQTEDQVTWPAWRHDPRWRTTECQLHDGIDDCFVRRSAPPSPAVCL